MSLTSEHAKIRVPWTDGLAVLMCHDTRDLMQVCEVVHHPGRHQLSQGDDTQRGMASATFCLDDPGRGLYIPELVWARLYDFSVDAVCLAAASTHYDNATVIRDWDTYLRLGATSSLVSHAP